MPTKEEMQDRLAKMRAKIANTDVGGSGGYWSPPQGSSIIRILPEVGKMEFFYQEVGKHGLWDFGGKEVYCAKYTSNGEFECPICELVSELYKSTNESDKVLAGKLRMARTFFMNVIVRDKDDENGNTGSGPLIFTPGVTIFGAISALVNGSYGDVTDIDEGTDLEISKKGEKIETRYNVFPRHSKHSIPLSRSDEQIEKWLEDAQDLSWVMLSNNPEEDNDLAGKLIVRLLPYDRMLNEIGIGPGMDVGRLEAKAAAKSRGDGGSSSVRDKLRQRRETKEGNGVEEAAFPPADGYDTVAKAEDEVGSELARLRARRGGNR